jgi:hypothetical protein
MYLLDDIITYVRRIIKSPSNNQISDSLIIDYINRFWINDVDARIQLFDLKKTYSFQTTPGVDQYNMPLYNVQIEDPNGDPQNINSYPVYQGFLDPCYINGIKVPLETQKGKFFNIWPNIVQNLQGVAVGDGGDNYDLQVPIISSSAPQNPPLNALLRGHVDITGIIATGSVQDPPIGSDLNTSIAVTSVRPAVYITSIGEDGANVVVTDSGQFFTVNQNLGMLMNPKPAPGNTATSNMRADGGYFDIFTIFGITLGTTTIITMSNTLDAGQKVLIQGVVGTTELNGNTYTILDATDTFIEIDVDSTSFTPYVSDGTASTFQNFVNYLTGEINVTFPVGIPAGNNINVQVYYFQSGLPRSILYYDNVLTLRSVPAQQYLVELEAYLSPAAYLNTADAITFGYMSEYIARGAARKILSDTGDVEQFNFYEPFFREQEQLVWKRSQRQWTATRTETLYSQGFGFGQSAFNSLGGNQG